MKTVIIDFELGLAWELEVPNAYRFDFDATQEALNMMHNLRVSLANDAGLGWNMLFRAKRHLEAEMTQYFAGK